MFLRCYKIQFPGWNLKPLKSSDMQSGIKASLKRSAGALSFSPLLSLNMLPLQHSNSQLMLWNTMLLKQSPGKCNCTFQLLKQLLVDRTLTALYCYELCQDWEVTSFYIFTVDEYTNNIIFPCCSPLDPKLEERTKSTFEWVLKKTNKDI